MELTERAKWLTEYFQEKARDWVEISTDELIEEYRKAFPDESPTPGYIYSQLEALEQMGMITIDRPEFGQKKPTRYLWSGAGAAPAAELVEAAAAPEPVVESFPEPVAETYAAPAAQAFAEQVAETYSAPVMEATPEPTSLAVAFEETVMEATPEPIPVAIAPEPAPMAEPAPAPISAEPVRTVKPTTREVSVSSTSAEQKLIQLEGTINLIRGQLGEFESAAGELRRYIEEQGEVIERQVILDEPGLDYRMETIKVRKRS